MDNEALNQYRRVLLISYSAFKEGGSNGKVLSELFRGWNKDCLAQLYFAPETPDWNVCNSFFRITDQDVVRSLCKRGKPGHIIRQNENASETDKADDIRETVRGISKTALTLCLREMLWSMRSWKSKELINWVDRFNPEVILVFFGSSAFIPMLALQIAKMRSIPIIAFTTENYYFKDFNYLVDKRFSFLYPVLRRATVSATKKLMMESKALIYTNDVLKNLYDHEFHKQGYVIYQGTNLKPFPDHSFPAIPSFMYAGNLGLDRHKALLEVGEALQHISPSFFIDVYGYAKPEVQEELKKGHGVRYHGRVSYEEVLKQMEQSDFLFHVESFSDYYTKDLVTAFSTKISDCLASGRVFILYAPGSIACAQYIKENDCGCLVTQYEDLEGKIKELISNAELRKMYIDNALRVVVKNHTSENNARKLKQIIERHVV